MMARLSHSQATGASTPQFAHREKKSSPRPGRQAGSAGLVQGFFGGEAVVLVSSALVLPTPLLEPQTHVHAPGRKRGLSGRKESHERGKR